MVKSNSGLLGPDGKPVGVSMRAAAAVAALRRYLELSGAYQGFGGGLFVYMQNGSLTVKNVNAGCGEGAAPAREVAPVLWQALADQAESMIDADDGVAMRVRTPDGTFGVIPEHVTGMQEALGTHDPEKIKAWFSSHGLRCSQMPGLRFAASVLAAAIQIVRERGEQLPPGAAELARGLLLLVGLQKKPELRAVEDAPPDGLAHEEPTA